MTTGRLSSGATPDTKMSSVYELSTSGPIVNGFQASLEAVTGESTVSKLASAAPRRDTESETPYCDKSFADAAWSSRLLTLFRQSLVYETTQRKHIRSGALMLAVVHGGDTVW
jgi:hypothetical protein